MDRIANARRLRQEHTDAERKLWSIVRGRKLDGFKFRRQVPIDRYFADFVCMEARLVVELDGASIRTRSSTTRRGRRFWKPVATRCCAAGTPRC